METENNAQSPVETPEIENGTSSASPQEIHENHETPENTVVPTDATLNNEVTNVEQIEATVEVQSDDNEIVSVVEDIPIDDVKNEHVVEAVESFPVELKEEQFLEHHQDLLLVAEDAEHHELEEITENYNTLSKEELLQRLEQVVAEPNAIANKNKAYLIRDAFMHIINTEKHDALSKFIEDGGLKDDFAMPLDDVAQKFHDLFERYKHNRTDQLESIEKQKIVNLVAKNEILSRLKTLIQNEENMQRAYHEFNELQNRWRAIGPVPASNVRDLHMTYKVFVDRFYDFVKINKELQALDQKKNFLQKAALCDKAEELILEPSVNKAIARIHEYMNLWRDIGPVARDKQQEIWDRFKSTVDKIFDRKREYYDQQKTVFEANLAAKKELAEKAEVLANTIHDKHNGWQEAMNQVKELQQQFKAIGFAHKKENELVWSKFRTACDTFFKNKNEFYQLRKKDLSENLQRKTELCIQAEGLIESSDWKNTQKELIRLQDEWKKSGPVSEKHNQKLWKRFKDASDAWFAKKRDYFSNIDKEYETNLENKLKLIEAINNFEMGNDNSSNLDQLKTFQREWSEIGLVPLPKKDEIHKKFRAAIDALYHKLNIDEREKSRMQYDEKIDRIKTQPGAKGKMSDEKYFLQNKIKELSGEVTVWENNIGFFGRSKNADVIKKEFEDKIKKAQNEIAALKEKLKTIKSAE